MLAGQESKSASTWALIFPSMNKCSLAGHSMMVVSISQNLFFSSTVEQRVGDLSKTQVWTKYMEIQGCPMVMISLAASLL